MVKCSSIFRDETGIEVSWDKRSLQDFESFSVEELAQAYDLIVIDHPHVGQITASKCVSPFTIAPTETPNEYQQYSTGPSYQSYFWEGQQWALPIDAAAQVQAYRPDIISKPPTHWKEVIDLASKGQVVLPLRSPHALMCFYTLAANRGSPCNVENGDLIPIAQGAETYRLLEGLVCLLDSSCFEMDPIDALEAMAAVDSPLAVMPYGYGYVSYALSGFRPNKLVFTDIPDAPGGKRAVGSTLGGTGIAVSAFSQHREEAMRFAHWIASGNVQCGPYATAGGQPGHASAWKDPEVNSATGNFYSNTLSTLEASYIRPRHDGYMHFQNAASERLCVGLQNHDRPEDVINDINFMYRQSRKA